MFMMTRKIFDLNANLEVDLIMDIPVTSKLVTWRVYNDCLYLDFAFEETYETDAVKSWRFHLIPMGKSFDPNKIVHIIANVVLPDKIIEDYFAQHKVRVTFVTLVILKEGEITTDYTPPKMLEDSTLTIEIDNETLENKTKPDDLPIDEAFWNNLLDNEGE